MRGVRGGECYAVSSDAPDKLRASDRNQHCYRSAITFAEKSVLEIPSFFKKEIGWILFHARRYDEAIRELRSLLAVHPDDAGVRSRLAFALIGNGQPEEAIPEIERTVSVMHRSAGSLELLATAYGYAGHRVDALRIINEMNRRRETTYVPAGAFINPYLSVKDYDQAFLWFQRAYLEQSNILQFLKVHPFFDPIRGDSRFQDLVHRVGLG